LEEAQTAARALGDRYLLSYAEQVLGHVELMQGDLPRAGILFQEALAIAREFGDGPLIAHSIEGLAALAAAQGKGGRALQLVGQASAVRKAIGVALPPTWRDILERELPSAPPPWERGSSTWIEDQAITLDQAIAYALEEDGG
jgi:hypothetical protein